MELLISFSLLANLIVTSNAEDRIDPVLRLPFFNSKTMKSCSTKKDFRYLSKQEKKRISDAIGAKEIPGLYPVYNSYCDKKTRSTYLLNDIVRSEYQTLLISFQDDKIVHFEVVRFDEPVKYKAPSKWYKLFLGKDKFETIDAISGATLTRASTLKLAKLAHQLEKKKNEKK